MEDKTRKLVLIPRELAGGAQVTVDREMVKILMALDGKRDLDAISEAAGLVYEHTRSAAQRLVKSGLADVVEVADRRGTLPSILTILAGELSRAIGPVAGVVLSDEIEDMGELPDRFPGERVPELINMLARQIPRSEKRRDFQQAMLNHLKGRSGR